MDKGIRATLCVTLAFGVLAGFASGCRVNTEGDVIYTPSETPSETTVYTLPVTVVTSAESDSNYKSVKDDYNGELPSEGKAGNHTYKILTLDEYGNLMYKDRGYYIDALEEPDSPYFIVICSGEKNTGGYDIKITDIGLQDGELLITVEESSPDPDAIVTQAITYPYTVLKLDKMPGVVRIFNTKGEIFRNLNGETAPDSKFDGDPRTLENDYKIPDGWIASLRNGAGEIMEETFVYKDGNGFKCINVESTTVSWGATKWKNRFKSEVSCATKDDVVKAAKDFGSAGFMILPNDLKTAYSIDDFLKMDI